MLCCPDHIQNFTLLHNETCLQANRQWEPWKGFRFHVPVPSSQTTDEDVWLHWLYLQKDLYTCKDMVVSNALTTALIAAYRTVNPPIAFFDLHCLCRKIALGVPLTDPVDEKLKNRLIIHCYRETEDLNKVVLSLCLDSCLFRHWVPACILLPTLCPSRKTSTEDESSTNAVST